MKKIYFTFYAIICFSFYIAQVPTNGLLGAWLFSGNANDATSAANNGVVYGASLTTDRCGNSNSAYNFNGISNYIQMPNYGPLGSNPRSVSLWILSNNTATNPLIIFDYGHSNGVAGDFGIVHNYNCQGVGIDISNQAFIKGNSCINNGSWHHIVATFDPTVSSAYGSTCIYVDGILQSQIMCHVTGTNSPINTVTLVPIQIGKNVFNSGRFFKGSIDDVYLYNRAITPAEVLQLFNTCSPNILGNNPVCPNSTNTFSIQPLSGVSSYTWTSTNGWTGNSTSNSISILSNIQSSTIQVSANLGCGSTVSTSLAVNMKECIKTGILEKNIDSKIEIYPNPTKGELNITLTEGSLIRVFNTLGQLVWSKYLNIGSNKINLNELNNGVYFLYSSNTKNTTIKIIKE